MSPYNTDKSNYKNLNSTENSDNNKYMGINSNISEIPKKLNFINYQRNIDNIRQVPLKQRNNTFIQQTKDNSLSLSQDIKKNNFNYFISPSPRIKEQKKVNINTGNLRYYNYSNKQPDYKTSTQNSYDYQYHKISNAYNYYNQPKYKNKNKKININNYDYNKIFTNQSYDLVSDSYNYKNNNSNKKKYPIIIVDKNKRYRFSTYNNNDEKKSIIKIQSVWRGYYLRKIAVGSIKKYIGFIALMKYLEKTIKNNKKDLFNEIINLLKKFTDDKNYKYRFKRIRKNNDINSNNKKENNETNNNYNNNNRRFRNFNNINNNESNNVEKVMFKNVYYFNNVKFEPVRNTYDNKRNNDNNNKRGITIYFVDKEKEKEKEREREKEQRKKDQIDREKENEKRRLEKEQRKKEQIEREKENEKRRLEKIKAERAKREREKQEKELKEILERKSKEKSEKELKEKREKELKEKKEKELKEKREKELNEKREKELKEKREKELKEKREKELNERREKELREKREKDIKERFEKVRIEKEKYKDKDKGKETQIKNIENHINNKIINWNNNNVANDDDIFSKPIKIIYVPKRVSAFNNNKNSNKYYHKSIARAKKNKIEKMIKCIYRECYLKNYPILLYQLKILRKLNLLKLKISSLKNIFNLIQKKKLKKYLKNYREAVLNEKVKEEILKKNMNLFKLNKEKNTNDKILQHKKNEIIYQNADEINDIILEDNNENEDETNINKDNENKIEENIILRGKRKYLPKNNKLALLSNIINKKINLEKKNYIELLDKHFKAWNKYINKYNDDLKPKIKINLHSPDMEIRGTKSKKKFIKVKYTKAITSKTSIGSIKSEGKSNSSIQTKKMRIKNVVVNPKEYITTTLLNNNPLYNSNAIKTNKKYIKLLYIMDKIDDKTMKYKCFKFWKKINNK